MRFGSLFLAAVGLLSDGVAHAADDRAAFFESKVRPILAARCHSCHGAKKQESGLRLDTKAGFAKGGENGAVVDAKQPDQSELVLAIRREGGRKMPPDKPLPAEETDALIEWVRRGAFWPEESALSSSDSMRDAAAKHWAFQPVSETNRPASDRMRDASATSPIDHFIRAKLRDAGLSPTPKVDRPPRILRRRSVTEASRSNRATLVATTCVDQPSVPAVNPRRAALRE